MAGLPSAKNNDATPAPAAGVLRFAGLALDQPRIMGIVNVTPDSFSDGGHYAETDAAIAHGRRLREEGAAILDIGGESTRPGAEPVAADEERRRVLPVIERLASLPGHGKTFVISVDTMKPAVARDAVNAGADVINDVGGLRDAAMLDVIKETESGVVIMHMQGDPRTMQSAPHYADVVCAVREFFSEKLALCARSGIPATQVALDPGIGFGKTPEHNLALLRDLDEFTGAGHPIAVGVSRKSFIGKTLNLPAIEDRSWATVALTSWCRERGARIFRVHEVKPNVEALRMTEAILAG